MKSLGEIDVTLVDSIETAWECSRWLSTKSRVAIDTETTGLSPETDDVRLISIGDEDTAYVIPIEDPSAITVSGSVLGLGAPDPSYLRTTRLGWGGFAASLLRRLADDPAGPVIDMHNASFDHSMINHSLGVWLPRQRIHDTRLMVHTLDSQSSLGLKQIATRIVDPRAALGQDILSDAMNKKTGWNWRTIPISFQPYWFYAGLDTILTRRVCNIVEPKMLAECPRAYDIELAYSWPTEDMERRGVRLDIEYTEKFKPELDEYAGLLRQWCDDNYGLSPGSDAQIIDRLLYDGVNLTKKTASGSRYSADKEVLEAIQDMHPLAKTVLNFRKATKLAGYLNGYLEFVGPDGLIHPSINTVGGTDKSGADSGGSGKGVRTGRSSMSDPNLQNVPARTAEGKRVRKCFIPRQGNVWVKVDADQIESRILAHLSRDPHLIEAFNSDGDFFVNLAKRIYSDPDFEKSDPRRGLVKNTTYGKVYGAGPDKLARTAGVSLETATEFTHTYDRLFGEVPKFIRTMETIARERYRTEGEAYVRCPLTGRKHRVDHWKVYPVTNYVIQGLAAAILKLKVIEADQAGIGQYMLYPVHDEIDLDVPPDALPDVMRVVKDVMCDDKLLSVPITWSAEVGPSWGEVK